MGLLKRLLGCHDPRRRHLESCAECRLRLRRERQYLERLRGAEVPAASDDLTARLLAHTEELARTGDMAGTGQPAPYRLSAAAPGCPRLRPATAGRGAGGRRCGSRCRPARRFGLRDGRGPRPAGRRHDGLGLPAAGPCGLRHRLPSRRAPGRPPAGASPANRISPRPGRSPRRSSPPCAPRAGPALSSANSVTTWSGPAEGCWPASTSWNCASPTAGTSPPSSNSTVNCPGRPALRRAGRGPPRRSTCSRAGPRRRTDSPPRRFRAAMRRRAQRRRHGAGGILWVNHGSPFAAIYQSDGATFTYVSDQPAEQADDGVAALVHARHPGRRNRPPGTADGPAAGTTSPRGWSAGWAGSWSCWPRDRGFRRGPAPCVTAESSQLRLRG